MEEHQAITVISAGRNYKTVSGRYCYKRERMVQYGKNDYSRKF